MSKHQCPVCNCHNTEAQIDYPHISECNKCGSEWITESGEILLDARDYFTDEENQKLNRNQK